MSDLDEKVFVLVDEAIRRIGDGDYIHTFLQAPMGILLGADWPREDVIELFTSHPDAIEETGPIACARGHGLAVWRGNEPVFIETRGGAA